LGIEIRHLLTANGFDVKGIWGGTAGQWNKQPLQLDEMELMIKAKRRDK
jgi:hypothetical protein